MIAKTDDLFPIERVFEIFSEIKKSIPNLSEISMDFNEVHPENISDISVTFEVLKWFKSIEDKYEHPLSNPDIFIIFYISKSPK